MTGFLSGLGFFGGGGSRSDECASVAAAHGAHVAADPAPPLVVDLDGTLIGADLLIESAFAHFGATARRLPGMIRALFQGKAAFKSHIAAQTSIEAARLPYDERVIELIKTARAEGRRVVLASASNERYVADVCSHLALFDDWFASNDSVNLSAETKAQKLVEAFGAHGFDYIGNDKADLPVWREARLRYHVRAPAAVRAKLADIDSEAVRLDEQGDSPLTKIKVWARLLRVHQWSKNALVFVPLLTSQHVDPGSWVKAVAAFLCFSLAASGVYLLNDIVDVAADRAHPTKRKRPFAAGTAPILGGLIAAPVLFAASLLGSLAITPIFALTLAGYLVLTTAYTFGIKRMMMVDVIALAGLYTIRVFGGAAAIDVPVSEWLLGFSMFIFTALALVKRYVELAALLDADLPDPSNRNYRKADLDVIAALAAAAAFNAVTVFALYISSETTHALYRRPIALWLICPVLMYWLGRILIMAHRRLLHDDPVVFALKDKSSLAAAALIGVIMLGAI